MQRVHFARITVLLSRKVSWLPMEESSGKCLQVLIRYFLFIPSFPVHGTEVIQLLHPLQFSIELANSLL